MLIHRFKSNERALAFMFTLIVIVTVTAWIPLSQAQQQRPGYSGIIDQIQRFRGQARLSTGETTVVEVDVRNWTIGGGARLDALPLPIQGLMVVQLRGGTLTTIINGNRRERFEGEIWTVPTSVPMGVETEDDSAILQTVVMAEQP